jgi:O-antigen/teichoic acid export membrane protein
MMRRSVQMTLGVGLAQAIQLVAAPLILRLYGASAFGTFSLLVSAANMISVIATLRLDGIIPVIGARLGALRLAGVALLLGATMLLLGLPLIVMAAPHVPLVSSGSITLGQALLVPLLAFSQGSALILRAVLIRFGEFGTAARSQVARAALFVTLALALGPVATLAGIPASVALGLAQVMGDATAIALCVLALRPRYLLLMSPLALGRMLFELRVNRNLVQAAALGNILNIFTQAIPLWTVGLAFGAQAAGWFSAAQRLVLAPTAFVIATAGIAFAQHLREKIAQRRPIGRDLLSFIVALIVVLGPFFLALGLFAASGRVAWLGSEWSGVGNTLMAMIFVTLGSIPYVAAESLPALLRLNQLFVFYHAARLTMGLVLAAAAIAHFLPYVGWLWIYVGVETLSYAACSLTCFLMSRRQR